MSWHEPRQLMRHLARGKVSLEAGRRRKPALVGLGTAPLFGFGRHVVKSGVEPCIGAEYAHAFVSGRIDAEPPRNQTPVRRLS